MGRIVINISGGTSPYYVTLDPDQIGGEQTYNLPQQVTYEDIPSGDYTLTVRDFNNCEVEHDLTVP